MHYSNPHFHLHMPSSPFVLTWSSSYKETSHIGFGIHPTPVRPDLNRLHLQQPYFLIQSHSKTLGVWISIYVGGVLGDSVIQSMAKAI